MRNSLLLFWVAGAAAAQEVAPLESVIVTAQRRPENIRDVPMSVSTIRDETLDTYAASGRDLRYLATRTPSLHIESDFGRSFPRFYLRGLGNTDFDLNASQPVSVVYDDVVQESPLLKSFPLFDIDQVEVLRGPQGTLFGRNSTAGVIKFASVRPRMVDEGYAVLGLGKYGALNAEGAANRKLGASSALRISILSQHRDNRVFNDRPGAPSTAFEGYHDTAMRLQYLYQPGANFSALANLHVRDMGGRATVYRANIIERGTGALVPGFDYASLPTDGINKQALFTWGASLRLRWDLDGITLHSITGYENADFTSRADVDAGYGSLAAPPMGPGTIPFTAETRDALPRHRQLTQEVRAEAGARADFGWVAGLYAFDESITVETYNYDTLKGNVQNGYAVQDQDSKAWAAFASLHWRNAPALLWAMGMRYTHDQRDFSARRLQAPPPGVPVGPLTANPRSSNTSWDASVVYSATPDTNLYARAATGYRAPSIQGRIIFGSTISVANAERALSVEAGIKQDLFDKRGRASFALYQYRVNDMQLTAGSGAINQNRLVNAARVEGKGAEGEFEARLSPHWRASIGGSYTDVVIRDPALFVVPCGNGCTVLDPRTGVGTSVRVDGNPLPRAPRWIGNVSLRYTQPWADGELFGSTDWSYRGRYNYFLYEAAEYRAVPLLEGGLRGGYRWQGGRYEAAAYVRNLANRVVLVNAVDFNNMTGVVSEPRSWGVQLRMSF